VLAAAIVLDATMAQAEGPPPMFFDPVVTTSPGISREMNVLLDHTRDSDRTLTFLSARLQYPVASWLQLSLEMPLGFLDRSEGSPRVGAGDLLVGAQASVWTPREWPAQVDVGFEVALPTGDRDVLAGSTTVRVFIAGGLNAGPIDLVGNISYAWGLTGPAQDSQLFQASLAAGYRHRWVAPFVELVMTRPVEGFDQRRAQVALVPGIEFYLSANLSLSVGVQLPVGSPRFFDQRVMAFFKWPF
jgi:Putative MetA-pathway of phenol degradation